MNPNVEEYYRNLIKRGKFTEKEYPLSEFQQWVKTDGAIESLYKTDIADGRYTEKEYPLLEFQQWIGQKEIEPEVKDSIPLVQGEALNQMREDLTEPKKFPRLQSSDPVLNALYDDLDKAYGNNAK